MNRIDHRPAVPVPNGADGGQMQRRMLQELERQWLDNWSAAANAAEPEPAPAAPEQEASAARPGALTPEGSAASLRPASAFASSAMTGESPSGSHQAAPPPTAVDRPGRQASEAGQAAHAGGPAGRQLWLAPLTAEPTASVLRAATITQATGPAGSTGADLSSSADQPAVTSTTFAESPMAAGASVELGQAIATQFTLTPPSADASEPGASATPASRPRVPQATDGRLGPQRLTLRELAPDRVRASLRDTQLDTASSQLAAQGLARALMEAGYAQVNVVVNGQHSRGERRDPDDAGAAAEPRAILTDSFSDTAPKDISHGN